MKNEIKELGYMTTFLLITIILLKIVFYSESILTISKLTLSIFWLYIIPGFFMMYLFKELPFIERMIIGTALGMAFFGVIGYNLGVFGLHIKYQIWILPIIAIIIGIIALRKKDS